MTLSAHLIFTLLAKGVPQHPFQSQFLHAFTLGCLTDDTTQEVLKCLDVESLFVAESSECLSAVTIICSDGLLVAA